MKKITVLTALLLVMSVLLCGCGKKAETPIPEEPSFTPMDTTAVIRAIRVSDGSIAFEDEFALGIAEAYNTITEFEAYDEEATPTWEVVFICTPTQQSAEGSEITVHRISFLGDNTFNITLNSDDGGKCKVVSETLYNAFAYAILGDSATNTNESADTSDTTEAAE